MDEEQALKEIESYMEELGLSDDEASVIVSLAFSLIGSISASQMRLMARTLEIAARAREEEEEE